MSDVEHVFAGIAVADFHVALAWYERLFGRAPDVVVRDDEEVMWQLVPGGWVYVVHNAERAGQGLLTILVRDLQRHVEMLVERGIAVPEIETEPGLYRKIALEDPLGNMLSIGENLGK